MFWTYEPAGESFPLRAALLGLAATGLLACSPGDGEDGDPQHRPFAGGHEAEFVRHLQEAGVGTPL